MATVEVEGPDTGWVASVGYDDTGDVRVLDAREGWRPAVERLVGRLLMEPAPSGRIPGAHVNSDDEDTLYDLAATLMRRKPDCRGERLTGYVSGGSRYVDTDADYGEE